MLRNGSFGPLRAQWPWARELGGAWNDQIDFVWRTSCLVWHWERGRGRARQPRRKSRRLDTADGSDPAMRTWPGADLVRDEDLRQEGRDLLHERDTSVRLSG